MSNFNRLLVAREEELINILFRSGVDLSGTSRDPIEQIGKKLGLKISQMICAVGFNPNIRNLSDIAFVLGFPSYDALAQERNKLFVNDVYQQITLKKVVAIYSSAKKSQELLEIMQYLVRTRLRNIELCIEETVSAVTIENYKKELRSIYYDGIAHIEFAEERLNETSSGFRALVNEVAVIVDTKLIPVGEIFFRDNILPEEKRKLLSKGLIPDDLIVARLNEAQISEKERAILEDHLKRKR